MSNGAIAQAVSHTKELPPLFVDDVPELQYDFPVKNETGQPVRFTKLIQGCACMGASRIDAMSLAPGEETILHFHVDLRQRKGRQQIVCRLLEAGGSEWFYAIETTLYQRTAFAENGALHFGMVDPNCEEVRDTALLLRAENADSLPREVSFRTDSTNFRVEAGEPTTETLPDEVVERKIPLKFYLHTPEAPGLGQATVFAEFTRNDAKQKEQTGISWNVRSFYAVEPQQVFFVRSILP